MRQAEAEAIWMAASEWPRGTGIYVGHGHNSVDGASGAGWLCYSQESDSAKIASVGAPRPQLREFAWSRDDGGGYSSGCRYWVARAADVLASLPSDSRCDRLRAALAALVDREVRWKSYSWCG